MNPTTADGDEKMQVDEKPIIPEARDLDVNFVDDDDLQAVLARSRRAKLRKPQKLSPEEVAKKSMSHLFALLLSDRDCFIVAEQRAQSMNVDDGQTAANDEDDGLTFDDTSEFVRSITYDPSTAKKEPEETTVTRRASPPTANPDVKMEETDVALTELEAGEVAANGEDYDDEMLDAIEHAINAAEAHEQKTGVKVEEGDLELGTSGEKTHSSGMAATLNILRQQGILATPTAESTEREKVQLQRDLWLADQRRRIGQREFGEAEGEGGKQGSGAEGIREPVEGPTGGPCQSRGVQGLQARRQHRVSRRVWAGADPEGGLESAFAQVPWKGVWKNEDGEEVEEDCGGEEAGGYGQRGYAVEHESGVPEETREGWSSSFRLVGRKQRVCLSYNSLGWLFG
jgi:hypothetical protein